MKDNINALNNKIDNKQVIKSIGQYGIRITGTSDIIYISQNNGKYQYYSDVTVNLASSIDFTKTKCVVIMTRSGTNSDKYAMIDVSDITSSLLINNNTLRMFYEEEYAVLGTDNPPKYKLYGTIEFLVFEFY